LTGHVWALALSSDSSWLETDRVSIAERAMRPQPEDPQGPLTLAAAASLTGGGRLALTADSDLAANGFIGYAGNLSFLNNALFWLLGAEDDLARPARGSALLFDRAKARVMFWLPVVVWPGLLTGLWLLFFLGRRRRNR
jgi:hypothetical protein